MTHDLTHLADPRILVECVPAPALLHDANETVVAANVALASRLGKATGELRNVPLTDICTPPDNPVDENPVVPECMLAVSEGDGLNVLKLSQTVPASALTICVFVDISETRRQNADLKEQYRIVTELSNTVFEQAVSLKRYAASLEQRVRQRTAELHQANIDAIYMLAEASEAKDEDTGQHVRRLQRFAKALALELGMGAEDADEIGYSAILHDVGKMHVPDQILKKAGQLDDDEREAVVRHTIIGEKILADKPFFTRARRIARWHHENFDGSGYPDGLAGDAIPIEARIVHLADVYDALVSSRVYKEAWTPERAAKAIIAESGRHFDPTIVRAFERLWERGFFDAVDEGE